MIPLMIRVLKGSSAQRVHAFDRQKAAQGSAQTSGVRRSSRHVRQRHERQVFSSYKRMQSSFLSCVKYIL